MMSIHQSYLQWRVARFHKTLGQVDADLPLIVMPDDMRMRRARIFGEEALEKIAACIGVTEAITLLQELAAKLREKRGTGAPGDIPEIADGCIDTAVTAAGTLCELGIDDLPLMEEVMDKNDAKVGGGKDAFGKFKKPAGWTPPDIAGLIEKQRRRAIP
jgi:predicted HAD superfamily Cof-like phosphohydrolase